MSRRAFDPLSCLPDSQIVEQTLAEAEARAEKLRALLRIVREVESAPQATSTDKTEAVQTG
jgi:hypothetical protein